MFHKDSSGEYLEERLQDGGILHYKRRRVLGKGGFAKCYEVTDQKTNIRYACKVIDKDTLSHSQLKEKLQSEIEIHRKMSHPNIVKFERVFEDDKYIYILLELCINNTLNELLKRRKVLSEVQVRFYMVQLLEALKYLHKHKIVHRDLKLDNFFLGENLDIKIGDFGLAAEVSHRPRKTICGTPNYIAPEIMESKNGYSYEVDVWSLGVTVYLLLYGHYPFENSDSKSITSRINAKTYLINPSLSDMAKNFISRMLQTKPQDRWTVKQLLQHEFLTYFQIPKNLPRSSLACSLNSTFLDQFICKKVAKLDLKDEEQFNFMLQSKESHSSPRAKHSTYNQSMSASKILKMNKQENLPYIYSQKKVDSFREYNLGQIKNSYKLKEWLLQWWENPNYGLLYQSTQGTYGVRFNDATNLKAHPYPNRFTHISSRGVSQKITLEQVKSGKLEKSMKFKLKIFSQMMEKVVWKSEESSERGVYVKMYVNSKEMFLIWLSNGQLQCRFQDKSQLVIGKEFCMYINPNKIKIVFQSKEIQQQNQEIVDKQRKMAQVLSKIRALREIGKRTSVLVKIEFIG